MEQMTVESKRCCHDRHIATADDRWFLPQGGNCGVGLLVCLHVLYKLKLFEMWSWGGVSLYLTSRNLGWPTPHYKFYFIFSTNLPQSHCSQHCRWFWSTVSHYIDNGWSPECFEWSPWNRPKLGFSSFLIRVLSCPIGLTCQSHNSSGFCNCPGGPLVPNTP